DKRTLALREHVVKASAAVHQAHQIQIDNAAKLGRLELALPVDDDTLRKDEHIEAREWRLVAIDGGRIGKIEPSVMQPREIAPLGSGVILGARARAPDMHLGAVGAERLSDAVADAAGAAGDEHRASGEIERLHSLLPDACPGRPEGQ